MHIPMVVFGLSEGAFVVFVLITIALGVWMFVG